MRDHQQVTVYYPDLEPKTSAGPLRVTRVEPPDEEDMLTAFARFDPDQEPVMRVPFLLLLSRSLTRYERQALREDDSPIRPHPTSSDAVYFFSHVGEDPVRLAGAGSKIEEDGKLIQRTSLERLSDAQQLATRATELVGGASGQIGT